MRHIKASVALILLIVFTSLNASCGALKEPTETTSGTISKETVNSEYKKLDVENFYIAVGYSQPFEMTRLMHFEGQRTEYVWWIQDKDDYCFGGIYVLNEKLKPQIEARKYKDGPWEKDVFGSYVELDMMDCFWAELIDDSKMTLLEHEAAKWLDIENIDSVDWLPADIKVVEAIKKSYCQ